MKTEAAFKNRERFIELGIVIAALRKRQGFSQDALATKADISRSTLSAIEAANMTRMFSVDTLYKIADALGISAGDLLNYSLPASNL
ncbi:helix-turn-helix domain-containing protein [Bariatricus sp. HCP28S3_D3]|uniref:helix-turn-helix domain-containing protein n=1 Tax=Bariatricus sp. HCP28S3_D3 TaxID=3438901 RepID=UPI003F8CAE24